MDKTSGAVMTQARVADVTKICESGPRSMLFARSAHSGGARNVDAVDTRGIIEWRRPTAESGGSAPARGPRTVRLECDRRSARRRPPPRGRAGAGRAWLHQSEYFGMSFGVSPLLQCGIYIFSYLLVLPRAWLVPRGTILACCCHVFGSILGCL